MTNVLLNAQVTFSKAFCDEIQPWRNASAQSRNIVELNDGYLFAFAGTSLGDMSANVLRDYQTGVNIRAGIIGAQGGVNEAPGLNSWQSSITNHFFAEDGTVGSASNFVLNTWNSPLYDIVTPFSAFNGLDGSSPITTTTLFQQNNFEQQINNGCVINNGGLDIGEYELSAYDIIKNINDSLFSSTLKNDLTFQFLNQYKSDTAWESTPEAELLYDSLSNTLIGKLYQIQETFNRWPNIDNLLGNINVSGVFSNYRNEIIAKIYQLDSLQSQNTYFANLIDVFKLQASKLVFDADKVLFYQSLNQLSADSLIGIFESDSLLNFKLDSTTFSKIETMALSSAKINGIPVYQARSIFDSEFLMDDFYLNPLELPSNQSNLRLSNIDVDNAKNLVENGSFEQLHDCPTNTTQLYKAKFWSSPNQGWGYESIFDTTTIEQNGSNPDLFAQCNNFNFETDSFFVSDFNVGPFEGENFAGIRTIIRDLVNNLPFFLNDSCYAREYLQGTLKSQLVAGKKYIFSMRVALTKSQECEKISNKLSILFTSDSLNEYSDLCGYTPQIVTNTYFDINDDWMLYQTEYIANGTENYFSIGVFLPNDKLELINNPLCEWPYSFPSSRIFYLIDDVRLECIEENGCGLVSNGVEIRSQKLNIFPNPAAQQVTLAFSEPINQAVTYTLTDLQGRQLLQGNIQNQETMLDISHLSKGIYLLNISDAQGNKWNKKIVKGE